MARSHADILAQTYARTIGIAQGGGGLWFPAHVGVLRVLQEEEIPLHAITGASGGALVGAIASSWVDDHTGLLSKEGVDYMQRAVQSIRTFADLTHIIEGRTVLDLHRILEGGGASEYQEMMRRGPVIPFSAQVARHDPAGIRQAGFLEPESDDDMECVLQMASASAANHLMFKLDPVEIDGIEYSDDLSVATRSVHAGVQYLRNRFAGIHVIGTSLSFKDSTAAIRRFMDVLRPAYADCGDVRILPKDGHQAFDGADSLTNVKKGSVLPFMGQRYARSSADLASAKRIPIPVDDFIAAGYQAAKKQVGALLRLIPHE